MKHDYRISKRALSFVLFLSLSHLATWPLCRSVSAQVPHLVRYQGQAMDSNQVPLEGPYTLTFRLYNAETAGTTVWEETQTGVSLQGGHFSVLLGQVTSLTVDWSTPLWLSIQVGAEPELSPRQRITSVPLAVRAEVAERLATGPIDVSARVTHSAAWSVPHNTRLAPSFDTELWDTADIHSLTTNPDRLTAPSTGKYLVFCTVEWYPQATGYRYVNFMVNGTTVPGTVTVPAVSGESTYITMATTVRLAAEDRVVLRLFQTSGGALTANIEFGMIKLSY